MSPHNKWCSLISSLLICAIMMVVPAEGAGKYNMTEFSSDSSNKEGIEITVESEDEKSATLEDVVALEDPFKNVITNQETVESETQMTNRASGFTNQKDFLLNEDGTGIVMNNIGKRLSDIQGKSEEQIKKMIITDSLALAFGMKNGQLVDVTEFIQIDDLNGLQTISSTNLTEFKIELKVLKETAGIESDLSSEIIVYTGIVQNVNNWSDLESAVTSMETTIVNIQSSFIPIKEELDIKPIEIKDRPNLVVLGNGNSVDFLAYIFRWGNTKKEARHITIDNLDMYGMSYYGPFDFYLDRTGVGSTITYRNINYLGAQLSASYQATVIFEGKNRVTVPLEGYTSHDGKYRKFVGWNMDDTAFEVFSIHFKDKSDTDIKVANADGVILASYYADIPSQQPELLVGDNANVKITTYGDSGEDYGIGATSSLRTVIDVQRHGKFIIGENSTVTAESASASGKKANRVPYRNSRNSPLTPYSYKPETTIGKGSTLNLISNGATYAGDGLLILDQNDQTFNIEEGATLNIISRNSGDSKGPMVEIGKNVGSQNRANFNIKSGGSFIVRIEDGYGVRNMIQAKKINFNIDNPKTIDFDGRKNSNTTLIYGEDYFQNVTNLHNIYAWPKEDRDLEKPTLSWELMTLSQVSHFPKGSVASSVSGSAINKKTADDFIANYKTQNFSRVLFEGIPEVEIAVDSPSDNQNIPSGQKITGRVNSGAHVRLYKDGVLLGNPTLSVEDDRENTKFHVIADEAGNFSYDIPSDMLPLVAGQEIKAYGWKDYKSNKATAKVIDKTPPTGEADPFYTVIGSSKPDASVFVKNPQDSNSMNGGFSYKYKTDENTLNTFLNTLGEHTVEVILMDTAGNEAVIESKLGIYDMNRETVMEANDFEIQEDKLKKILASDLEDYIIDESQAEAYKIIGNRKTDYTDQIKVADFGGLTVEQRKGVFTVKLNVPGQSDLTTELKVTVIPNRSKMTLKQVYQGTDDQIYQDLEGKVPVKTISEVYKVDDLLDDLLDDLIKTDRLTLNHTGYNEIKKEDYEVYVNGVKVATNKVPDEHFEVIYKYSGQLYINAPDIDFGTVKINSQKTEHNLPQDAKVVVVDTLKTDNWQLKLSLPEGIINTVEEGIDEPFIGDLVYYVSETEEQVISEGGIIINEDFNEDVFNTLNMKGDEQKGSGLKLRQHLGNSKGSCVGELHWELVDGPNP